MPKVSKDTASQIETMEGFEGRYEDLAGYTVGFETYTEDADPSMLFKGLPDDACQSPHFGYVMRGKVAYRYTDGNVEEFVAGDAYHATPGHTPLMYADTELIEFSPTAEMQKTMEVVLRNLEAQG